MDFLFCSWFLEILGGKDFLRIFVLIELIWNQVTKRVNTDLHAGKCVPRNQHLCDTALSTVELRRAIHLVPSIDKHFS